MKELQQHSAMDNRTVKAWETNKGGFVQVYDVRDLFYDNYSVECMVHGGMQSIYSSVNLEKCIARAIKYAEAN